MCVLASLGTWIFSRFRCSSYFQIMLVKSWEIWRTDGNSGILGSLAKKRPEILI